jgi:disulfide bond formation protein DsbB
MNQMYLYMSWLVSAVATAGSLYFSNVMMLPPCSLCWWQRICMFPLLVLFTSGFIRQDKNSISYTTPLIGIGWTISTYHNLLYYKVIEKSITACTSGVSCTSVTIEWLGFITIPLLAFTAFTLLGIITLIAIIRRNQ